jgi:hypothetical protein
MNRNNELNFEKARSYDLVDYLSTLGFNPSKIVRNQYWYLSPFRIEKTPSFKVNRTLNRWWDFGDGRGGDLIDFAIAYHRCTIGEFIRILEGKPASLPSWQPAEQQEKTITAGKIIILRQQTLSDPALLRYLVGRRIPLPIALTFTKEVTFELYGKIFHAIGFANDSGGFELRNAGFKGSSSPKHFTSLFSNQPGACLNVFEGFFDFLSYLTLISAENRIAEDYLILNSLSFFEKARLLMESYTQVNLFLGNDNAGHTVTDYALSLSSCYQDSSGLYHRYPDLNDFLVFFGKHPST